MRTLAIVLVLLIFSFSARAEDWTVGDKTYRHVKVTKVDDDKVHITFDGGIGSVPLASLPPELREKFGYDPAKAKAAEASESRHQDEADAQISRELAQAESQRFRDAKSSSDAAQYASTPHEKTVFFFYGKIIAMNGDGILLECRGPNVTAGDTGADRYRVVGRIKEAMMPQGAQLQVMGYAFVKGHPSQDQASVGEMISGTGNYDGYCKTPDGESYRSYMVLDGKICTDTSVIPAR